jgi:hypothetical protein
LHRKFLLRMLVNARHRSSTTLRRILTQGNDRPIGKSFVRASADS